MIAEESEWAQAGQFYCVHGDSARLCVADHLKRTMLNGDHGDELRWTSIAAKLETIIRDGHGG